NLQVVQLVRGDAAGGPDVPRDAGRIGAVDDRTAHDVAGAVVNDVQGAPESSDREVVVVDGRQRGLTVLTVNVERPVLIDVAAKADDGAIGLVGEILLTSAAFHVAPADQYVH